MELVFRKEIEEDEIREQVREAIEDKLGIEILGIN